jgi:hypothetical protein
MKKKNPPSGVVGSPLKNHQSYTWHVVWSFDHFLSHWSIV